MELLFLLLILLISVFRVFDTGPGGQLISDGVVLAGLLVWPLFIRRRRQGAEFLLARSGKESALSQVAANARLAGERLKTLGVTRAFLVWVAVAGLAYMASLRVSQHTGMTLQGCRQVVVGVVLFGMAASFRVESGSFWDLLLGLAWGGWLVLFLGPLWGPSMPRVWDFLGGPFPAIPALPAEVERPVVILGVVALESWLACVVLVSSGRARRLVTLSAHTLLWGLWGALGGPWLPLVAGVTLLVAVACCPSWRKAYWSWALTLGLLAGGAWFAGALWGTSGGLPWAQGASWQPPFGESAWVADYRTALFHLPLGVGALGREAVRAVFSVDSLPQPVPGGQQILWAADLGVFGPVLSAVLLVLLAWSVRFAGYAYGEGLEPSREPKALQSVKESEWPAAPVVIPVTLLAWMGVTFSCRGLDLFRAPVFWVYLGLWVAWLAGGGQAGGSKGWRRAWIGTVLVFAILFVLVGGMRESGRYHYRRALSASEATERKAALATAQSWDRWNPEYAFRLARLALEEGQGRPEALTEGRRHVERGLRLAPADGAGQMLLSRFERADGRLPEAIASAERAVFFAPDRPDLRRELAGLYESTGLLTLAAGEYRWVLNLRPDDVEAHLALARLAEKEGRYTDALEGYRQVLMLDRQQATARARYESLEQRLRGSRADRLEPQEG